MLERKATGAIRAFLEMRTAAGDQVQEEKAAQMEEVFQRLRMSAL